MDINVLKNEIEELTQQLIQIEENMYQIRGKIIPAVSLHLQELFKKDIEEKVKTKVEITKLLGVEKLRDLKNELNHLIEETPKIVEEYFNKKLILVYEYLKQDKKNEYISSDEYSIKKNIEEAVRDLLGYEGKLIIKYGYEKYASNSSFSDNSSWERLYNSEIPKYRYGISLSKNIEDLIKEFRLLYVKYHITYGKLNNTIKQKKEQEAVDLWEQA